MLDALTPRADVRGAAHARGSARPRAVRGERRRRERPGRARRCGRRRGRRSSSPSRSRPATAAPTTCGWPSSSTARRSRSRRAPRPFRTVYRTTTDGDPARASPGGARLPAAPAEQPRLRAALSVGVRVAIHQPHYLPWLGYLAKWAAADVFVFLDTVQYEKNGWQNRNRIKTAAGPRWLTVPVHARLGTPIARGDRRRRPSPGASGTCRRSRRPTRRRPTSTGTGRSSTPSTRRAWPRLAPLAVATAEWLARAARHRDPGPARLRARGRAAADPTERLVALCRAVGADTYLAGRDGARYMDVTRFADGGDRGAVPGLRPPRLRATARGIRSELLGA